MTKAYEKFLHEVKSLYAIKSAQALLGWDQETMLPPRVVRMDSDQIKVAGLHGFRQRPFPFLLGRSAHLGGGPSQVAACDT